MPTTFTNQWHQWHAPTPPPHLWKRDHHARANEGKQKEAGAGLSQQVWLKWRKRSPTRGVNRSPHRITAQTQHPKSHPWPEDLKGEPGLLLRVPSEVCEVQSHPKVPKSKQGSADRNAERQEKVLAQRLASHALTESSEKQLHIQSRQVYTWSELQCPILSDGSLPGCGSWEPHPF